MKITVIAAILAACPTSLLALAPFSDSQRTERVSESEMTLTEVRRELQELRRAKAVAANQCAQFRLEQRIAEVRRSGLEKIKQFHSMTGTYPDSASLFLGENYNIDVLLLSVPPAGCAKE